MDKHGAEQLLSIYWFLILIIIAGGIFGMVYVFYSYPYDFRDVEARTLSNQVADCIAEGGQLKVDLNNFDILKSCNLNFNDETYQDQDIQYYVQIGLYDLTGNKINEISAGNSNFIADCAIQEENSYKRLVTCSERSFYVSNNNIIKILSIVRKTEKNTK